MLKATALLGVLSVDVVFVFIFILSLPEKLLKLCTTLETSFRSDSTASPTAHSVLNCEERDIQRGL